MPGKKKRSEAEKKSSRKGQENLRAKRKESGLKSVTLYLDELTREELGKLCVNSGYDDPIKNPKSGTDALSNTIGALIRKASGMESELSCSNDKAHQELYNLHRIVCHRKDKHQEKKGKVAKFLNTNGYSMPSIFFGNRTQRKTNLWLMPDVQTVAKISSIEELLEESKREKKTVRRRRRRRTPIRQK